MVRDPVTTKAITTTKLDDDARELIRAAGQGKIRLIFEEDGKPVAAVMPLLSAEAWEADREDFFATIEQAARRANLSEAEAEEIALEAVKAVRSDAA